MGEATKIQWCDHTFNPWRGCQKVAPGCVNCYAESQANRNPNTLGIWGPNGTRVVAAEAMWLEPAKWNNAAGLLPDKIVRPGSLPIEHIPVPRRRVFCGSMMDWAEDWKGSLHFVEKDEDTGKPINTVAWCRSDIGVCKAGQTTVNLCRGERLATMDDARADLFRLIDSTPHLDWLLLTKRPGNIRDMIPAVSVFRQDQADSVNERGELFRPNVGLGTSIACQEDADRNIPELLKCRDLSPVLFLSIEPLIEPVNLRGIGFNGFTLDCLTSTCCPWHPSACNRSGCNGVKVDWVIVGGESGPNARPCRVEWIRDIVRQCRDAGVPCFVKQLGANVVTDSACDWERQHAEWPAHVLFDCPEDGEDSPIKMILRDQKGGDPDEWPADLRVREFPEPASVC